MSMGADNTDSIDIAIYRQPERLLRDLLRFDTTNPPGNEAACIAYLRDLLDAAGIQTTIVARDPARPNLVARLAGQGAAPPLLLYGHVDVVTTEGQAWTHPPFAADEADGFIWGRGTLDMKGGIAMMAAALLRAKAEGAALPGDVLFAALSDEEDWGDDGARYLVEEYPDLFAGVRYALGELGGFTQQIGPVRFYPIMVAEKQGCAITATLRGPGGHGSLPLRGGAMAKLARFLRILDEHRLPVHVTPATSAMIETAATHLGEPFGPLLRGLLDPTMTDALLDQLGPQGALFDPLLHNTVNATVVRGGEKENVIPSEITVALDGRVLPGYTSADLLAELRALCGGDVEFTIVRDDVTGPATPDMTHFETLGAILRELDPDGVPLPLLLSGVTDGRFLSRLGIQTYGYLPMRLPPDMPFTALIHAADERIPVEAVAFGTEAIYRAIQRLGG